MQNTRHTRCQQPTERTETSWNPHDASTEWLCFALRTVAVGRPNAHAREPTSLVVEFLAHDVVPIFGVSDLVSIFRIIFPSSATAVNRHVVEFLAHDVVPIFGVSDLVSILRIIITSSATEVNRHLRVCERNIGSHATNSYSLCEGLVFCVGTLCSGKMLDSRWFYSQRGNGLLTGMLLHAKCVHSPQNVSKNSVVALGILKTSHRVALQFHRF